VIYNPNWMMKGMIYLKSRYLTLRAVMYKPMPKEAMKAIKINTGKKITCQPGKN